MDRWFLVNNNVDDVAGQEEEKTIMGKAPVQGKQLAIHHDHHHRLLLLLAARWKARFIYIFSQCWNLDPTANEQYCSVATISSD